VTDARPPFSSEEMDLINAARRCIDFHLSYRDFCHDLVMQGVSEILNSTSNNPGVEIHLTPSLPPGTFELRYGRRVVGSIVNLAHVNDTTTPVPRSILRADD